MRRTGRVISPRRQRERRSRAARALVMLTIVFLTTALFRLQVLQGEEHRVTARDNRLRELPIPAPRGTIYDRTGRVVAENIPGYMIQVMPGDAMEETIAELAPLLGVLESDVRRARRLWTRQPHLPLILMQDAPERAVAAIAERRHLFPNVLVHQYAKRLYPAGAAVGHFIGYVNEINDRQLASPDWAGYVMGQWVGQTGLERQYERYLGGVPGKRYLEIDARGRIQRWLPESMSTPPVPGRDLHLHLDLDLQEYIHQIFPRDWNGAVVAMDPQSGGVLAYYSYPTFDPNQWTGGISQSEYDQLYNDSRIPLLDRVVGSTQPAASTWKLAVAGLALDLGIVRPDEYMPQSCGGSYSFQGVTRRCWNPSGHGRQNLIEAVKNSCNVYFYQLGVRIGLQRYLEHGTRLGFADRTGIDVPHELRPNWPSGLEYWENRFGYRPYENEVLSLAIGQGPMLMTIMKLAHIYSALTAPDGRVPAPRLANFGPPADTFEFRTTPRDRWHLEAGMRRVVAPGGTAGLSRVPGWDFIGKTGTAQAPSGPNHGWFVGTGAVEPGAQPEIAVTMFLEHGESGAMASGYVGEMINFYLSRKHNRPFEKFVTPRIRTFNGLPYDYSILSAPIVDPPMPAPASEDQRRPSVNTPPGQQQ